MEISTIKPGIHLGLRVYKGELTADDHTTWVFEAVPDNNYKVQELSMRSGGDIVIVYTVGSNEKSKIHDAFHHCGAIIPSAEIAFARQDQEIIDFIIDEVNNFICPLGVFTSIVDMLF